MIGLICLRMALPIKRRIGQNVRIWRIPVISSVGPKVRPPPYQSVE